MRCECRIYLCWVWKEWQALDKSLVTSVDTTVDSSEPVNISQVQDVPVYSPFLCCTSHDLLSAGFKYLYIWHDVPCCKGLWCMVGHEIFKHDCAISHVIKVIFIFPVKYTKTHLLFFIPFISQIPNVQYLWEVKLTVLIRNAVLLALSVWDQLNRNFVHSQSFIRLSQILKHSKFNWLSCKCPSSNKRKQFS